MQTRLPRTLAQLAFATLLLLGGAAASLTLAPGEALACKCQNPGPTRATLDKAHAVFMGEVVKVKMGPGKWPRPVAVTFKVHKVWKGQLHATQTAVIPVHSCAITIFKPGETWLIFGSDGDKKTRTDKLSVRQCVGSRKLAGKGGALSPEQEKKLETLGIAKDPSP